MQETRRSGGEDRGRAAARALAFGAALLGAVSFARALAQEAQPPQSPPPQSPPPQPPPSKPPAPLRPPQLADLPTGSTVIDDAAESFGGLQFSDLERLVVSPERGEFVFQADMKEELADGFFTKIDVDFDFDGRREEAELSLTGAVGSRYRPSSYVPPKGLDAPLELLRASWASPFDERRGGSGRIGMTNWAELPGAEVGGRRLRFRAPRELVVAHGKGSTTPPAFRARIDTTCSEHPIAFDYDALDAGRAITTDGRPDEWSGGPCAEDPAGELHEVLSHLDLRAVWCEHSADAVFVRIDLDRAGFGTIARGDGDVSVSDALFVRLEPRGGVYMDDVEVSIPATVLRGRGEGGATWVCGSKCVEVTIPRNPKETRFRVVVWTDARRSDVLGGGWMPVPPEWWK